MTVQERTERANMKRRRQIAKRRIILLLAALFVITVGSIICGSIFSSAKDSETDVVRYTYYKSIMIEQGDSLWSIAKRYNPDTSVDTRTYIDELKQLNNLTSETIHAGQHLVIAYCDTEIH